MTVEIPEGTTRTAGPIPVTIRLRPPEREGVVKRFESSDPSPGLDLARNQWVARLLKNRKFQFLLIVPNQIVFWTVIFVGFLGTADPGLNFGTAITWYVWFCLVFVMMVVVGRAWCAMCPFGGFGEWIQRRTFWQRTQKTLSLGRKFPEPLARMGFVLPVISFLLLTWVEEFFNIAAPGKPAETSFMVIGIVASALIFFLVFERRTFCRYICPLTSLIGTVGSMGTVAGFRTREREVCLTCKTKDCMRGSEEGFGCPWYTWPGSADSNLYCGLCTECFKSCPEDNVGLFLQKPLTSVVAPQRRRADIAWAIVLLWGLVLYQQLNALPIYTSVDDWLNAHLAFPHYPNPVAYLGIIAALAALTAGIAGAIGVATARRDLTFTRTGNFADRTSQFRTYFLPISYGLIPIVGADYFARQLPKFFRGSPRVIPAIEHMFGFSSAQSPLYNTTLLNDPRIINVQVGVIALGTLGAMWAMWRIVNRDLLSVSRSALGVRVGSMAVVLASGIGAGWMYVLMQAAG